MHFAPKVRQKSKTILRSNSGMTLGQQIKRLRVSQKPYMTQLQLCHRAGIVIDTFLKVERDQNLNIETTTLRKIAHALGCRVFVSIKKTPSRKVEEYPLSGPELPPLPERTDKISGRARRLAVLHDSLRRKKRRQRKRLLPRKETSETQDTETAPE